MLENPLNKGGATFPGSSFFLVGITGLEPATSRPPDVCATNCAKSRNRLFSGAKVVGSWDICKFWSIFFAH